MSQESNIDSKQKVPVESIESTKDPYKIKESVPFGTPEDEKKRKQQRTDRLIIFCAVVMASMIIGGIIYLNAVNPEPEWVLIETVAMLTGENYSIPNSNYSIRLVDVDSEDSTLAFIALYQDGVHAYTKALFKYGNEAGLYIDDYRITLQGITDNGAVLNILRMEK